MLEQSDAVKQAWQARERTLDIVINVDGTDYQATSINSLIYDAGAFTGDSLGIGSTYENSISAEFASVIEAFAAGQVVKPKIGIKVNGSFEYTPLGVFIISEVNRDRNNNLTTIKALDQMVKLERAYTSTLAYPASMLDVVAEIASQGGVTVNQTDLTHLPNLPKLNSAITGQTLRTAIGWIAQFYSGFAAFDRSGQLTIRTTATPDYIINPGEYQQGGLTKNEVTYKTGGIKVSVTTTSTTETGEQEDKTTTLQAGETSGSQIELVNNVMTNDALSTIWTSIKDVSFYPYSLNWFGNPALEAGDWVTLTDTQGNKFNVPVNQLTFTFNGGLESTISANQASQSSTVMPWTGPTQNAITQAITRKMATGNNVYDPSFTEEPKNAKIGDVWFKQNGNNVELWTYSRDSSGNASWQKQEVDGEVKAQVEKAIDEAENAAKLAIEAQTTADGKNSVYRGSDPNTVPTARLKEGDLYFTDNALYTWTGSAWEKTISDTTGAEIKAKVDEAIARAKSAEETADAKNKVYRVKDVSVIPTANLKVGDICFTDDAVYTWNGSAWEKVVSDTTGAEIKAKVDQVAQESQKAVADLSSNIESKVKDLDTSIQSTKTDLTATTNKIASDLSETKNNLATVANDLSTTKSSIKSSLDSITSDLSTTKNNLADTGNKLETAVSDFQKKTDQLSGSLETANSKIEFNSKAISEVKKTAEEISTTVSNIRVGGRNLLTNTRTLSDVWNGPTETVDGFTVAKATKTSGDYYDPLWWGNLTVKPNTDYVLTFYAKASKQTSIYSYLYNIGTDTAYNDGSTPNTLTTDYQRFVVHFHTYPFSGERQVNCIPVRLMDNGVTAWIYGVQLEEGNTATQWQPNPDDTDQAISKVSQTAEAIRADLTNTKGDVASVKAKADSLTSDMANAKGDISQLQQTAKGLTSRVDSAEGNISQLQQTAKGLESTVSDHSGKISQLQQTAEGLQSTVSNIRVGGRNLLTNTRTLSGVWYGETETIDNFTVAKAIDTVDGAFDPLQWYSLTIKPNTDYVLTFYAKASKQTGIYSYLYDIGADGAYKDGSTPNTLTTDYQRFVVHFHTYPFSGERQVNCIPVRLMDNGVTAWIYGVQLEEGNTATQWQPNPDDTDQAISKVSQTAEAIRADLTNTKGDVASVKAKADSLTSDMANAKGNISQLQQTADRIKFSMAGQRLDLIDGLDGQLIMGYGIPNTTWDGKNSSLTLPATPLAGEVLPQNGTAFSLFYNWEAGKTYTQSIIIETDAQINTSVQPQWTWFTNTGGHNQQPAELINLGNHCYRLIGSYTPDSNNAKDLLRIIDIWNFTSFVNVTTGTYLKFRSPHFFCADDNSLSELKITANSLNAYVKESTGSKTLASLLSMDPNNSTIAQVVNGKPIAAINLSSEGDVTIDGKKLHITASTTIDDASIGSAKIASLSADKITTGTLDASVVTVKNINADNITAGTLAAEHLHVTKDTVIDNGVIGNAQISNLSADKITAGTLDASQVRVINLDANSITTGSLSAAVIRASGFENYTVSPSNTWNFDNTKSTYGNWFLIGEATADHVYNGPKDANNNPVTPNMYVTSRGTGNNFTVTVWKDNDPTQYQRIWSYDHWTDWVILPNTQNLISTINISPDSVRIAGKKIMLDGDVAINGTAFANKLKATGITVDQLVAGSIDASRIDVINLNADNITAGTLDASKIKVINLDANSITTESFSAVLEEQRKFETFTVSPSNTWNFDYTKSTYGNWFLIGETTADHVYNGPKDANNNPVTPNMYVTSRGTGNNFTVTVWKDNDPTQYQRIWSYDHWTDWVILPNTQNIISTINLSPDGVMIAGKKITLDGNVNINGMAFANKLKATGITVDQLVAGSIDASKINVINLNANNITAGTIHGNNLSINLDNGQVAFSKGSLHSTDYMFNIDLDNKTFKIQTNNGIGLWIDNNGLHYKSNSTSDLWINKDGFHSYTDDNKNGTWIKDGSLTNADASGQGVTFQNGNVQFSSLPYWSSDSSKVYGTISRDPNFLGSSENGLTIEGINGVTLKTRAADNYTFNESTNGYFLGAPNGAFLTLANDISRASVLYSNSFLYLTGGPLYSAGNGWNAQATVSIGTDESYTHSGANMYSSNGTGRGPSISAHACNVNVRATDWISFEATGGRARIAFKADYIHMYPAYLKTTSAGANVYVAADGALLRSTSARKYKTDIQPANEFADYGDKLINLTPKIWLDKAEVKRYKDDPDKNEKPGYYYGLIADELDQAGLSKLVTYGADGQVEGIQYDRLAVALLPIIKQLKEDVKELKERILK